MSGNGRKQRLVCVATLFTRDSGGIPTVNRSILPALVELADARGVDLSVLDLIETADERPPELPPGARFVACGGDRRAFSRSLLHASLERPTFFFERVGLALPLLPATLAGWSRTVIFAHGRENWMRMRRVDRASLVRSALVITNSDYTLRRMRAALGERFRGASCPLGLSPSFRLHPAPPGGGAARLGAGAAGFGDGGEPLELADCDGRLRPIGVRMLLLVGRLDSREREKGHYPLLAVSPSLLRAHPDVQLVFAGYGDDRDNLVRRARELGVGGAVFLPGRVSDEMLERLYRRCYAYVMPSRQEGFGLVYLEAMNHAKACVGCAGDGAEDVIVDGATGRLVQDPWDLPELTAALGSLLSDPEATRRMGKNGFARLQERFTLDGFQERLKALVGSVLERHPESA